MAAPLFRPTCPRCGEPVEIRRVRVAGQRALVDGDCPSCGHRYLLDPAGWLDLTTGESDDEWLAAAWTRPDDTDVDLRVERRAPVKQATLAVCVDPDLARARAKLASALDESPANVFVVPAALEGDLPAAAGETWVVHAPLERLGSWLRDLEERVEAELRTRDSVGLVRLPMPPARVRENPLTPRRPSVIARVLDRARAALPRRAEGPPSAGGYAGPLPAVLRDSQGLLFEIEDREHATAFVVGGHFERDEIELASRYLTAGMTAVDVGANRGAFTAAMASSVTPGGVVHAFEPGATARAQLARTLELNAIENVEVVAAAASGSAGEAALANYGPGFESWGSLVRHEIDRGGGNRMRPSSSERVSTVTLDHYCERQGIERIDLLKVDVEGAEPLVLAGAAGLLARHAIDVVLIEVSDVTLAAAGSTSHELLGTLEEARLRTYVLEDGAVVPFRAAGPVTGLAQVIAASPSGRARLEAAGYSVR